MMLWLRLDDRRFALRQGETTLGRSNYCSVSIDSPLASRQHAAIHLEGERLVIEDLGSRNGTTVNGERIARTATLSVGDVIGIGTVQVQVVESAPADEASNTMEAVVTHPPRASVETLPDESD